MIHTQSIRGWLHTIFRDRAEEYVLVMAVAIVQSVLWAMMIPVVPLLARSLGAGEVYLSMIAILPSVIAIVLTLPGGALATKYGKRAAFLGASVLSVAGGTFYCFTSSLSGMIVPQMLLGLSNMLFWPTEKTYLTDLVPEAVRARVVGYSMAISAGGSILGPILSGYLIDTVGFRTVFVVYACLGLVSCLASFQLPRGERYANTSLLESLVGGVTQVSTLLKRPVLRITTVTTFLQFMNIATTDYFIPVFLRDAGYSATLIGATVTLRTTGMTLVRLFIGRITRRFGMLHLLFAALLTCVVATGLIPLLPVTPYVLPGSFVAGVAFGLAPVLTAAVVAGQTNPAERNLAMAMDGTAMYTSRVTSGMVLGALAQGIGLGPAIVAGNAAILIGLVAVMRIYRKVTGTQQSGSVLRR